ncbi:M48 family metallopeptidase [Serratia microhaemolytica]|uniref:M48 family metallopeptidase n=1 Tax=Serratia microhaemolytica TaxID=2675110 RepID=UPI000FDE6212|nr:M48 family metallopeptidase [Serratia microhaemolytica]
MSYNSTLKKILLSVVGLPVLFMLLASWQIQRSYPLDQIRSEIQELQNAITELQAVQQEHGDSAQIKLSSGKITPVGTLIYRVKDEHGRLQSALLIALVCNAFAFGTLTISLITLIIGGSGILYIRRLGIKAISSREALLQQFLKGKKILPWFLCGTGVFFVFSMISAISYELIMFLTYGIVSAGIVKLYFFVVIFVIGLLWYSLKMVWNIFKSSKATFELGEMTVIGHELTRQNAPILWELVEKVSQTTQTVMPDSLVIGLNEGFFVTENPVQLYNSDKISNGRTLYLPLPYMAFMNRAEISTIIAHELGHFTGSDTEYSLRFAPIYRATINNISAVYASTQDSNVGSDWIAKPALILGHYFLDSFHEAVQFWSRERELAADAVGVRAADATTFANALMRVVSLSSHVNRALDVFWIQAEEGKADIITLVQNSIEEHGFTDLNEYLNEQFPHPTDSHPTLIQRLEAQNIAIDEQLLQNATSTQQTTLLVELGLAEPQPTNGTEHSNTPNENTANSMSGSIAFQLQHDIADHAARSTKEIKEALLPIAQEGIETVVACETAALYKCLLIFFISMILVSSLFIPDTRLPLTFAFPLIAIMVIFLIKTHKNAKLPVITMTEKEFSIRGLKDPILWQHVSDISMTHSNYGCHLKIIMQPDAPRPTTLRRKVKYNRTRNELTWAFLGIKKMSDEEFFENLLAHWRGGNARFQLACLEGNQSNKPEQLP